MVKLEHVYNENGVVTTVRYILSPMEAYKYAAFLCNEQCDLTENREAYTLLKLYTRYFHTDEEKAYACVVLLEDYVCGQEMLNAVYHHMTGQEMAIVFAEPLTEETSIIMNCIRFMDGLDEPLI